MSMRHFHAGYQDAYLFRSPSGRWIVEVTGHPSVLESFDDEKSAAEYYEHRADEMAALVEHRRASE